MSDVHVIDPFIRETWRNLDILLFHIKYEGQEPLDVGRRDIVAIRSLDQGFTLDVEDSDYGLAGSRGRPT